jgi:hypothetical protein
MSQFASGAPIRVRGADNLKARLDALRASGNRTGMMKFLGTAAVEEAKSIVPKRTGNLARTIRLGAVTATTAQVKAGGRDKVGYAAHVEYGTKGGQMIRPVRKKALAWGGARRLSGTLRTGAKAEFFSMGHERGATPAKPYLVPGARKALERGGLKDAVVKAWNEAA